jgi:hypothetical protein
MNYKLEKWSLCCDAPDPYKAPEQQQQQQIPHLQGFVYNHPNFKDGDPLTTSRIVKMENGLVVTRSGSKYELGEVDPEWEKLFPNAAERFKNSFDDNGNVKTKPATV